MKNTKQLLENFNNRIETIERLDCIKRATNYQELMNDILERLEEIEEKINNITKREYWDE